MTGKLERLHRLMNIRFAAYFEDMALTSTQALTLEYIMLRMEHGDVFPKDVEGFLSIRGSSVVSLLNNLERDGYICRKTADFDGRYSRLIPTEKAEALREEISSRIDQYMTSLFIGIPETELQMLESIIEKIDRNVR